MKPVLFGAPELMLPHIAELGEVAPDMIEHAVEHYLYAVLAERFAHLLEILVSSEAAVDRLVIDSVIAVRHALENRTEINRVAAELLDMRNVVYQL